MKKVLITGASGGIGLETAKLLASKKYQLTLVARSKDKLEKALSALTGSGHSIRVADLTKQEDLQELVKHIQTEKYDVLINNAGAGIYGKFVDIPLADQLSDMNLNMNALVILSHAFLQRAAGGDTLINIASILAHASLPGASVYAGTKSFVANFSESLWFEFKQKDIYIFGFNPGATDSNFHTNAGKQSSVFPKAVLSSTEDVARDLVAAMEKRKEPRVVSGWKNRLMLFFFKFLNRTVAINTMGKLSPGMKP